MQLTPRSTRHAAYQLERLGVMEVVAGRDAAEQQHLWVGGPLRRQLRRCLFNVRLGLPREGARLSQTRNMSPLRAASSDRGV